MIGILWLFLQSAASHLLYLALRLETGSFPKPLSAKEEQAAFAAMRAGDDTARETLICHNLRLVAHIVKKYYTVSGGQDDFISIGTIGLIKAVDTYDCTRTTRFASYASRCIENELRMQLRHTRREAGTVSLQEPLETGADSGMLTLADVLPDLATMEEDCELRDAAAQLRQLVTALPEREQQILTLRYGLDGAVPQTQQQIAAQFGISRSYVSRIEKRALQKLCIPAGKARPCPPAPRVEPTASAVTAQTFAFHNSRSSADNCFCKSQKYDFSKLLALSPAFPL